MHKLFASTNAADIFLTDQSASDSDKNDPSVSDKARRKRKLLLQKNKQLKIKNKSLMEELEESEHRYNLLHEENKLLKKDNATQLEQISTLEATNLSELDIHRQYQEFRKQMEAALSESRKQVESYGKFQCYFFCFIKV